MIEIADWFRENKVELLLGIVVASFVFGIAQGYWILQIQYLLAAFGLIGLGYFIYHRKTKVGWTLMKGVQIAEHYFQKWTGHYVPIKEFYDITDQKRFSRRGRLFVVFGEDGPRKMAIGLDLAYKKISLLASDIRSEQSFLYLLHREPVGGDRPNIIHKLKEKSERQISTE
mgnify:CR=1 FL=1